MVREKTMFVEPKYRYLADTISLRNPQAALGSVKELRDEFRGAKTLDKKRRILNAVTLAANRANATLKKKDLSSSEEKEFRKIAMIYEGFKEELKKSYPARRVARVKRMRMR